MVGLPELRHSYQHRQKSVGESILACRNKVRLRIRSFCWQKAKILLALWFVRLFSFFIFSSPGFMFFQCSLLCWKSGLENTARYFSSWSSAWTQAGTASANTSRLRDFLSRPRLFFLPSVPSALRFPFLLSARC